MDKIKINFDRIKNFILSVDKISTIKICLSLFLIALIYHLFLIHNVIIPEVYSDEGGYIGNARFFLFGMQMPTITAMPFYYPGYSFLLIPALFLAKNFTMSYKLILITNSVLFSFLPVIVYLLTPMFSDKLTKLERILITIAVTLYPYHILLSRFAMSEILLFPLFIFTTYLLYKLCDTPKNVLLNFVLGIVFSFLWLTHPRIIAVLPALLIAQIIIFIRNKNYKSVLAFCFALIIGVLLKGHILNIMLTAVSKNISGALNLKVGEGIVTFPSARFFYNLDGRIADVLNHTQYYLKNIPFYIEVIVGHLYYLIIASFGFVLLGLFKITEIIKNRKNEPYYPVYMFCLFSLIFTTLLSAANHAFLPFYMAFCKNPGMILYGRYNEAVFLPIFLLGIVSYLKEDISAKKTKNIIITFIILTIISLLLFGAKIKGLTYPGVDGAGLMFYFMFKNELNIMLFLTVITSSLLLVYLPAKFNKIASVIMLLTFNIITSSVIHHKFFEKNDYLYKTHQVFIKPINEYINHNKKLISYDKSLFIFPNYLIYFTESEGFDYNFFDFEKNEKPLSKMVLSHNDIAKKYKGAKVIAKEEGMPLKLWLLP